jgi:hypothetical protein
MTIDMEFRARVQGAISNTDKMMRTIVRLEQRIKGLNRSTRASSRAQSRFGREAMSQVKQLAVSYAGFSGIIRGLSKVFGEFEAKQQTSRDTALKLARAEANFLINTSALAKKEILELERGIKRISSERGVERRVLLPGAGAGVSGAGGLPIKEVLQGLEIGGRLASAGEDVVREMVGATFDVKRALKNVSVPEAAGIVAQTAQLARIEEIGKTGRGMAGALTTLIEQGFDAKHAQAMFTTMSLRAADREGRRTATALVEFSTKFDKLFQGRPEKTFAERLKFMELHPRAQAKWAEATASSFWSRLRLPMHELVTKGSETNRLFKAQLKLIENSGATTAGRLAALEKLFSRFEKSSVQGVAKLDRTLKAAVEEAVEARTDLARLATIRAEGTRLIQQVAPSGISGTLEQLFTRMEIAVRANLGTTAPDVLALKFLQRIHGIAEKEHRVTKGLLAAIKQQAAQVSTVELRTAPALDQIILRKFMEQFAPDAPAVRRPPPAPFRRPRDDVMEFLSQGPRLKNLAAGDNVRDRRDLNDLAASMDAFFHRHVSKEETDRASKAQRAEMISLLKLITEVLAKRPKAPPAPNVHIENR